MADFDFSLHSLIRAVSDELIQSQRARIAGGLPALFEVEEFTIDVSFVATEKGGGGGGFDLKIIRADASMNYESSAVHKISLKMRALKPDDIEPLPPLPDVLPLRPRKDD
ncbi:MAG: trypco2 family protein [Halobacteriota archaeon]